MEIFVSQIIAIKSKTKVILKPHLHRRLFCNAIRRFLMLENLSCRVVTHTRQDSLAAIAFGKNLRRVSNNCDLRCRLYFCATRCKNRSRPWLLTRGRFQRLESRACKRGFRGYIVPGPRPRRAWAQGARKSSGFRVKFWYRINTP